MIPCVPERNPTWRYVVAATWLHNNVTRVTSHPLINWLCFYMKGLKWPSSKISLGTHGILGPIFYNINYINYNFKGGPNLAHCALFLLFVLYFTQKGAYICSKAPNFALSKHMQNVTPSKWAKLNTQFTSKDMPPYCDYHTQPQKK